MSTKHADSATETIPSDPGIFPVPSDRPWRDLAAVALLTVAATVLADHFQWSERLYASTRTLEYFQLDELPLALLALAAGLGWLAWRRYRHTGRALLARARAEARLAAALADNRRLAQAQLAVQEVEAKRLARELHDELGQYLNAIKLDALAARERRADPAAVAAAVDDIARTVDHMHHVVASMIARLRPVGLDELGLSAALENCVEQWRQRHPGVQLRMRVEGAIDDLGEALSVTVYRIVQEALTNVSRHADARRVDLVAVRRGTGGDQALEVRIVDDGVGLREPLPVRRFGLRGMRERVELAGGRFSADNSPGGGACIEAWLPIGTTA